MAIVTTPLGFQKPDGNEDVRNGDNVISANAAKGEELHQDSRGRLTVIEAKNTEQDGRLDAVESDGAGQGGRLDAIEAKQAIKAVKLEAGKWVWGAAGATHYVIPDHTGSLIVRATAQPVPAATPALDW